MIGRVLTAYFTTLTVYGVLLQSLKSPAQNFGAPTPHRLTHLPQDRKNDNNYLAPLIVKKKNMEHLQSSRGQGTLVVPFWPSASFWSFLQSYTSKEFNSYVVDFKVFTQPHQCFQLGNNKSSLIGSGKFKSQILRCSLDFLENN